MKHTISNLLYHLDAYFQPACVHAAAAEIQDALDAGVFDCLVQHPASKPPTGCEQVLVLHKYIGWRIARYIDGKWLMPPSNVELAGVVAWRELPPTLEVTE